MMHGRERSDLAIVVMKSPNKTGGPAAEVMERRAGAKENASQHRTCRTQSRESVSQTPERVRTAARLCRHYPSGSRMRRPAYYHYILIPASQVSETGPSIWQSCPRVC